LEKTGSAGLNGLALCLLTGNAYSRKDVIRFNMFGFNFHYKPSKNIILKGGKRNGGKT